MREGWDERDVHWRWSEGFACQHGHRMLRMQNITMSYSLQQSMTALCALTQLKSFGTEHSLDFGCFEL